MNLLNRFGPSYTCESFSPSLLASFFLSGLLMYFCFWKVLSSAFLWRSENTARRSIPLLGFPRGARGQEKVPGTGTTEEEDDDEATGTENKRKKTDLFIPDSYSLLLFEIFSEKCTFLAVSRLLVPFWLNFGPLFQATFVQFVKNG